MNAATNADNCSFAKTVIRTTRTTGFTLWQFRAYLYLFWMSFFTTFSQPADVGFCKSIYYSTAKTEHQITLKNSEIDVDSSYETLHSPHDLRNTGESTKQIS